MNPEANAREYWLKTMLRIVDVPLRALAERRLKETMPIECLPGNEENRSSFAHLEILGRTLCGMAPWLEVKTVGEEEELRQEYAELARQAIDAATDPASPDYVNFDYGHQPIVDAAFLAHGILRAPRELWDKLEPRVRRNVINGLKATRSRKPFYCNWLLFSAMIEALLYKVGEDWDPMRIDYALREHEQWFLGDGVYGDGPHFRWDYYNSFVIQPMLLDILETVAHEDSWWSEMKPNVIRRAIRYGEIQERLISPEGTFPPIGRSLCYRFGVFQLLAQLALRHDLPEKVTPAQVRCALEAVIRRMIEMPGTFDENGWLKVGFCGSQINMAERYICTGSLYLCTTVFLPLGLPPEDPFWKDAPEDWTSRKIWSGKDMLRDHAVD